MVHPLNVLPKRLGAIVLALMRASRLAPRHATLRVYHEPDNKMIWIKLLGCCLIAVLLMPWAVIGFLMYLSFVFDLVK